MEYLTCYLGLEHYGAHLMCPWCEASSLEPDHPLVISGIYASTPWNDFRADADWRQTSWNRHPVASWIASHPIRHPLFALPGVSIQTIMPDHLHICDLGVFQRIIGNLLFGMVFDRMVPGADTKSRVQAAWYMIEGEYVNLRISQRISGLTLSMFCNEKKIHGSQPSLLRPSRPFGSSLCRRHGEILGLGALGHWIWIPGHCGRGAGHRAVSSGRFPEGRWASIVAWACCFVVRAPGSRTHSCGFIGLGSWAPRPGPYRIRGFGFPGRCRR